jgi:hypothetical protein
VIDSCGSAGGRLPGQGNGGFGAQYVNTTNAKVGDLGSQTLKPRPTGVKWTVGVEYEVAWTIRTRRLPTFLQLCPGVGDHRKGNLGVCVADPGVYVAL